MCVLSIIADSQLTLRDYTDLEGWVPKLRVPSIRELQDTHLEAETLNKASL